MSQEAPKPRQLSRESSKEDVAAPHGHAGADQEACDLVPSGIIVLIVPSIIIVDSEKSPKQARVRKLTEKGLSYDTAMSWKN